MDRISRWMPPQSAADISLAFFGSLAQSGDLSPISLVLAAWQGLSSLRR